MNPVDFRPRNSFAGYSYDLPDSVSATATKFGAGEGRVSDWSQCIFTSVASGMNPTIAVRSGPFFGQQSFSSESGLLHLPVTILPILRSTFGRTAGFDELGVIFGPVGLLLKTGYT